MSVLKHLLILARVFRQAKGNYFHRALDWNPAEHPRAVNGEFTNGDRHEEDLEYNEEDSQCNEEGAVSAVGRHEFPKVLFGTKQNFKNHFKNHKLDLLNAGIYTEEEYERETRRVIESPVGGDIMGHIASVSKQEIVRYDKRINLFTKGNPQKQTFTSFSPRDGVQYYYKNRDEDLEHDGKE